MKKRRTVMLAIVVSALAFAGTACIIASGEGQSQVTVEVTCGDFLTPGQQHLGLQTSLYAGHLLEVSLCSNPSTGLKWDDIEIGDSDVLERIDRKSEPPKDGVPAASGKEIWTFKALKQGETNVSMHYSRPLAEGEKDVWTFNLKVLVR